jgi:integrase
MARESYEAGMPRRKRDKDGIFDRGDGWLYLQYKGRHALKTQDRETARALARDIRKRIDDPAYAAAHVTTLGQACEEYRAHAATGDNRQKAPSPETFAMYETHFGNLCRVMGLELPLSELTAAEVDRYIATRRSERIGKPPGEHRTGRRPSTAGRPDTRRAVSARTVDKELGTLRQILRLGLRRGWYHLPLERVLPESAGGAYEPLGRYLTLEQVPKLLDALTRKDSPNQIAGGYRGVYRAPRGDRWEAKITAKGKSVYVGSFTDQVEAARAYDDAARDAHGPKAQLNFPAGETADDLEGRAATCAYIVATGADWCAVERAERDDLGGRDACALLVLIRGTKNPKRWAEVGIYRELGELADRARRWLVEHGRFPVWGKQRCRDLAVACRRAGVPRVTVRDLRRSHGKALAALGIDPHLIGSQLRHTDSRMAEKTYAVPERSDVRMNVAARARRAS